MPIKKKNHTIKKVLTKKVDSKINKNIFIKSVEKRDGSIMPFEIEKITNAINKAMLVSSEGSREEAMKVAKSVLSILEKKIKEEKGFVPKIEYIQDVVEQQLMLADYVKASKEYILYREERARLREQGLLVPERVKRLNEESKKNFRNPLSEFVYYRSYAKWIDSESRRETWVETVDRYINFMRGKLGNKLKESEYKEIREAILKQESMPSMRLMQFAGIAADKTNVCAYNCSFVAPSLIQDFAEILYILMCGTGVGFSVESNNIQSLPQIKVQTNKKIPTYVIPDSKEGWADALAVGMKAWFEGEDVNFDFSLLRPSGARLKTFGGKSSARNH